MDGPVNESTPLQPWELTEAYEEQRLLLNKVTQWRTKLIAKPSQIRFAMALFYGKDVSCVAATGFGKSLAFQMALFFMQNKFGIVVTPINALSENQVQECKRHQIRAIALTEEALEENHRLLEEIMQGLYDLSM